MKRDTITPAIRNLHIPKRRRDDIARELESHLEDARIDLERSGLSAADADRESLIRLGDLTAIAAEFERVYRPPRRKQLGLALGLASALVLGAWGVGGQFASATSAHHRSQPTRQPAHVYQSHPSGHTLPR
jgi:hypothetical protein